MKILLKYTIFTHYRTKKTFIYVPPIYQIKNGLEEVHLAKKNSKTLSKCGIMDNYHAIH